MLASAITGLGKTVLLVVAITFILWSLYTALVVPKLEDSETFPPDGLVDQRPAHWRVVWTEDPQRQALIRQHR